MRKILILLLIAYVYCQATVTFEIYPGQNYQENTPSPRACFANCQFCQISNGICEDCFAPFFTKNQNGQCILLSRDYVLQSENNQLQRGQAFLPSNSWSNRTRQNCNFNPNFNLSVLGLFRNTTLQYTRTIGQHKYFALKFFFLQSNWINEDRVNIQIRNQNGQLLVQNNITGNSRIPTQSLCSNRSVDQRFSVKYLFEERQVSQIRIIFTPSMKGENSQWGIGNFAFISGFCDSLCQQCNFSPLPNQCKPNSCKNFHNYTSDGSCSNCANGFRKLLNNSCQKCPIEQQRCEVNDTICFYRNRTKLQLNNTNCHVILPGSTSKLILDYKDQKYVNQVSFSGSLFNVNGRAATTTCGPYSFVGLAQPGQTITRIFANTIKHIGISVSFNIFVQDQKSIFDVQPFVILIDGEVIETLAVTLQGTSNVCGNYSLKEVFTTYYPTSFYPHTSFKNVNVSISSEASNWGIRDLRVMFEKCDRSCLNCSDNDGCITCARSLQLTNLSCTSCISGFTILQDSKKQLSCKKCQDQNCQVCQTPSNCTLCYPGYFIFKAQCSVNPQSGSTFNPDIWQGKFLNDTCAITNQFNQTISFITVQDKLTGTFTINDPLVSTLVMFRLIKIDNWAQNEYLQLYINDLRLMNRNFNQTGQKICYIADQNQQISFETFNIRDNNSTITVQFSTIKSPNVTKKFGIADFKIVPFGCRQCSNFGFQYKLDYNIDKYINIQVAFNRIYKNDNFDQFKQIFKLMYGNKEIDYDVISTDYVRYMLRTPLLSIIDLPLTLICLYPQKVVTNLQDPINADQFFQSNRMMQNQQISPGSAKYLDNSKSSVNVLRSVPLGDAKNSAQGLRIFFQVLSRIVIYLGFASFFFGCQTPFTHLMHNFQKLWVHIWVASLAIPPLLKTTFIGFRETQDQNIAINPSGWQDPLPDQLYYDAPAQYQQYYHDITFLRNIYNIGFGFAILLFFFIIFKILFYIYDPSERWGSYKIVRHLTITYKKTTFFYINSIFFYQYFTLVLACYLQFIDLTNNTYHPIFTGINAAAAIVAYIFATAWPTISFLYLKYRQNSLYQSSNEIVYRNKYHQIFFRFLQPRIWQNGAEEDYINKKQELYNAFRYGQLWWIGIIVCLMYDSPFAQAFLLMITNFIHILLILFAPLQYTVWFGILKVTQLGFFIGLQILILVSYTLVDTSSTQSYETYGKVGVAFIFVIVFLSIVRTIYTFYKIFRQYDIVDKDNSKIDNRRRNIQWYDVNIDNQY